MKHNYLLLLVSFSLGINLCFSVYAADEFIVNSDGDVGITTDPENTRLDIKGSTSDSSAYGIRVRQSNNNDSFVVRNDGKVGIGRENPQSALDVNGGVRVWNVIDSCGDTNAGTIRYSVGNELQYCHNNQWVSALTAESSFYEWMANGVNLAPKSNLKIITGRVWVDSAHPAVTTINWTNTPFTRLISVTCTGSNEDNDAFCKVVSSSSIAFGVDGHDDWVNFIAMGE